MTYLPRIADGELTERLASSGAVLIEGPRACGKTATALHVVASPVRAGAEVELGATQTDAAAASLIKFSTLVDTEVCGKPAALVVITGTGYAYQRPDGVSVVPIGALGP